MAKYNLPQERIELLVKRFPKNKNYIEVTAQQTLEKINQEAHILPEPKIYFSEIGMKIDIDLIETTPEEVEGIKEELRIVYDRIIKILREFTDLEDRHYSLIALWIIGTYFHDSFNSYPYLFLNAMRGSGKTRLLKLIASLSNHGEIIGSPTEAILFRIPKGHTLCIDEFEGVMRKGNEGVREMLNASYKKGMKVRRMKQQKTKDGSSEQVIEEFEPYRPICLANIYGMEEVLGDRCIPIIIDKSERGDIMRLIEDFEQNMQIKLIKHTLETFPNYINSYFNITTDTQNWNKYVKNKYGVVSGVVSKPKLHPFLSLKKPKFEGIEHFLSWCSYEKRKGIGSQKMNKNVIKYTPTYTTLTTQTTQTTLSRVNWCSSGVVFFEKIDKTGINGRNLELFFPLMYLSKFIDEMILNNILNIASDLTKEKRKEEMVESKDVTLIDFVSKLEVGIGFKTIRNLTLMFRTFLGNIETEEDKWINEKWVGRALTRLKLIVDKRRMRQGIEVTLDINKAKQKMGAFDNGEKD